MRKALMTIAAAAAALSLGVAATASAAPGQPAELDCGTAGTFTVITNGNGQFTPGRLVGGGVVVPVAFSNQHSMFTDNEGNVFEEFPPDVVKGNGHPGQNHDLITCDFSITFEDEGGSGSFSGTVTGFIAGG
jgi:hypothetical protein